MFCDMATSAKRFGNVSGYPLRPIKKERPCLTATQIASMKFGVCTVSKWLCREERGLLCSVAEGGDIVEVEGEGGYHHWGIALPPPIRPVGENASRSVMVACLRPHTASSRHDRQHEGRVAVEPLDTFWPPHAKIRINNRSDRAKPYHAEEVIRSQINYALNHRTQKWHNCEHFAYWCRHGEIRGSKPRQATDVGVWGSLAATAGAWMFIRNRARRLTE